MSWPRQIYVATTSLGVYYTGDFSDPSTQPTWAAINTGLAATDCREFWLDPFDPADRQYVLLNSATGLYRRESGGAWTGILSRADVSTLTGFTCTEIPGFCVDATLPGRLWATAHCYDVDWYRHKARAVYSDDYGDSWQNANQLYNSNFGHLYDLGSIRARGDEVWVSMSTGAGGSTTVRFSTNAGSSWTALNLGALGSISPISLNPLLADYAYMRYLDYGVDWYLARSGTNTSVNILQTAIAPMRWDAMWFDPGVANRHRMIFGGRTRYTDDAWATYSSSGAIAYTPISIAPWSGADNDQMLVGLTLGTSGTPPSQPHVIGALYGEADTTPDRVAGSSPGVAPYTDSIPMTCGGLAQGGIQAVPLDANVYTYNVTFEATAPDGSVHTGIVALEEV